MGYYYRREPARRTTTTIHPNGTKTRRTTRYDGRGRAVYREVKHPNGTKTVTYTHPTGWQWFWVIVFGLALVMLPAKLLGLWSIPIYVLAGWILLAYIKGRRKSSGNRPATSNVARVKTAQPDIPVVPSPVPCRYCGASSGGRCQYCGAPR
jgi:hypothetical protein